MSLSCTLFSSWAKALPPRASEAINAAPKRCRPLFSIRTRSSSLRATLALKALFPYTSAHSPCDVLTLRTFYLFVVSIQKFVGLLKELPPCPRDCRSSESGQSGGGGICG